MESKAPKAKGQVKDFWEDLPEHVKAGIERAKKQVRDGKVTSHDEVMKKYAKYLSNLKHLKFHHINNKK